jgi:hypothetical protein
MEKHLLGCRCDGVCMGGLGNNRSFIVSANIALTLSAVLGPFIGVITMVLEWANRRVDSTLENRLGRAVAESSKIKKAKHQPVVLAFGASQVQATTAMSLALLKSRTESTTGSVRCSTHMRIYGLPGPLTPRQRMSMMPP